MQGGAAAAAPSWVQDNKGNLQRGAVLGFASIAIGLLTTASGVAIELASGILTDVRHGICVARVPGDSRPLWEVTVAGGWRPYDRTRCCGGAASVDHATQECRADSIIKRSARKRLALPVRRVLRFGSAVEPGAPAAHSPRWMALSEIAAKLAAANATSAARGESTGNSVGLDAISVRSHVSQVFGPASWAEEYPAAHRRGGHGEPSLHEESLLSEDIEAAVNEGIVQTLTESAGGLDPIHEWVPWERVLSFHSGPSAPLLISVVGTSLLALLAGLVTLCAPAARGSGIPEVKASVAGFVTPASFEVRTLFAKVVALSLCVGAGLAVGKEGPMIHIGACWGVALAAFLPRLGRGLGDIRETDLVCVGAAAGVSAAFGAPLGGVLFAVEELGPTLPTGLRYQVMIGTLLSAVIAALALKWLDLTRTGRLTLFEVEYKQAWEPWEVMPFCLLGALGGLAGGAFVIANEAVHRRRLAAEAAGRSCWFIPEKLDRAVLATCRAVRLDTRVLEVVLLAIFTGLSNYPHMITRMLQNDGIKALFSQCAEPSANSHDLVGLCKVQDNADLSRFLHLMLGAALLRFIQAVVTFGAMTPAGLFVPSLYVGGCMGRTLGGFLRFMQLTGSGGLVEPGIYAMVGAGAMLAGVSRLTVSLAVVLFELTGGLTYVVPFLLAVLIAKWTGDLVTHDRSVYDVHAELKGFTKVESSEHVRILNATLEDLTCPGTGTAPRGPQALWTDAQGRAQVKAIAALIRWPCPGFVALQPAGDSSAEVLGWVSSSMASACAFGSLDGSEDHLTGDRVVRIGRMTTAPDPEDETPDVSAIVNRGGVVRVRHDCPLQTAYCIFTNCSGVKALVSIRPCERTSVTITREFFMELLVGQYLISAPRWAEPAAKGQPPAAAGACKLGEV